MTAGTRCDASSCQQFGTHMLEVHEHAAPTRHFCNVSCLALWAAQRLGVINSLPGI